MSVVPVCYPAVDERVVDQLGRGPIDGSPWRVRTYAATCAGIAATVDQVLPGLQAAADLSADRRSEAVVALCEKAEKVVGNLRKVGERYGAMGSALDTYAFAFDAAQGQSWSAHAQAAGALDLIDTYAGQLRELARDSTVASWGPRVSISDSEPVEVSRPLRGWNEGSKIAYDAARGAAALTSHAGGTGASAWQAAAKSLKPSAIIDDIGTEASAVRAAGITKPSSWVAPSNLVPDGFRVLNNVNGAGAQLSNTTGILASANMVSFSIDNIVPVLSAKPYLPGVDGGE